jgi:hypothetical protein
VSRERPFPFPFTIEEAARALGVPEERIRAAAEIARDVSEERSAGRGRPEVISQRTYKRAVELRSKGLSLKATAEKLTAEGHRRGDGSSTWTLTNVARLLERRRIRQPYEAVPP